MRIMLRFCFTIAMLLLSAFCYSQDVEESTGIISPGESFTNTEADTIFYMNAPVLNKLLKTHVKYNIARKKIVLYDEQIALLEQRVFYCDSAVAVKAAEADYWRSQLLSNDEVLKETRIKNAELEHENTRIRQSRIYYFFAGVLATSLVYVAVK